MSLFTTCLMCLVFDLIFRCYCLVLLPKCDRYVFLHDFVMFLFVVARKV